MLFKIHVQCSVYTDLNLSHLAIFALSYYCAPRNPYAKTASSTLAVLRLAESPSLTLSVPAESEMCDVMFAPVNGPLGNAF